MVKPFQFSKVPRIMFRSGIIAELHEIAMLYGRNVVMVTGERSFVESDYSKRLFNDFGTKNISFKIVNIKGEPSPAIIDNVVDNLKKEPVEVVIAIGGGSVMDAGKAISAMIHKSGSVADYLEGVGNKDHPGTKIPFIAVPTTSGTGSEVTKNAVISQIGKNGFKRSLRHDNFIPDVAIVDPVLTLNCPPHITAASGMDCFTQLTEAYLSDRSKEYTDALAIEGLKAVKRSLKRSFTDGSDIEARSDMSFAALTSGICLANAGLGVIHGFASSIGARYDIPHGLICGTLMATSNEVNVRKLRKTPDAEAALNKYAILGNLFLEENNKSRDYYIDGFIDYLHELTSYMHLLGLKEAGVNKNDIEEICNLTESKNNPVKLGKEELMEILIKRFS